MKTQRSSAYMNTDYYHCPNNLSVDLILCKQTFNWTNKPISIQLKKKKRRKKFLSVAKQQMKFYLIPLNFISGDTCERLGKKLFEIPQYAFMMVLQQ